MKNWYYNKDGKTVTLVYEEGEVIVSRNDFNRAFMTMITSSYIENRSNYDLREKAAI